MPDNEFKIELTDPGITAQAAEKKFGCEGDRVDLVIGTGSTQVLGRADGDGLYHIPASGPSAQATVTCVSRVGSGRVSVIWETDAKGTVFGPNAVHPVALSTRLRFSLMSMNASFMLKGGKKGEIDPDFLQPLRDARIDDFWLVPTIRPDPANYKKVAWANSYKPGGSEANRGPYLEQLIDKMHGIGVQVMVGYTIVVQTEQKDEDTTAKKQLGDYVRGWAKWLENASEDDITAHAQAIQEWFKDYDIDGIGFDLECSALRDRHREKLGLLFRKTSDALAHRNGIVSYANAPFLLDGRRQLGFMNAQPYAHARSGLNLLARPMCYDDVSAFKEDLVTNSIACALRKADDNSGGGLHPSQVQFALWAAKLGTKETVRWCKDILRPNRIGFAVYTLPFSKKSDDQTKTMQLDFFKDCQLWEAALNPGLPGPGRGGQPLQVPRGYGGWPPPFKKP